MKEGRFILGTFRSERMRVRYRSRQNDRLRVMLVLVHIDIIPPQCKKSAAPMLAIVECPMEPSSPERGLELRNDPPGNYHPYVQSLLSKIIGPRYSEPRSSDENKT
ncbi:hypothetical protein TNCV_3888391 [Trichonephila clavipes]|nr:hypothetical protein TNCV_3888391 [Trichonephila clavipes]